MIFLMYSYQGIIYECGGGGGGGGLPTKNLQNDTQSEVLDKKVNQSMISILNTLKLCGD